MTVISVTVKEMEYTLDELVAAVASRLQAAGLERQANGQISAFPDRRTLRYYTTIGVMDRPDTVRNRQAIYGDRHVTQAVAVKRLQASGLALAAIQSRLAGLAPADVEAIAGANGVGGVRDGAGGGGGAATGRRRAFWAEPAADVGPRHRLRVDGDGAAGVDPAHAEDLGRPLLAIPLSPDATLLLATPGPLASADVAAIRDAAAPLLEYLDQLPVDQDRKDFR
jgi:DNA-binding transcriptional MerR regulator